MPTSLLPWILLLSLATFGVLGGLATRYVWPPSQRPTLGADPAIYAAYYFPITTAILTYVWLGTAAFTVCLLVFTPILQGPHAIYFLLGAGIGLGGIAVLICGFTLLGYRRVQRLRRLSSASPPTGASGPS